MSGHTLILITCSVLPDFTLRVTAFLSPLGVLMDRLAVTFTFLIESRSMYGSFVVRQLDVTSELFG